VRTNYRRSRSVPSRPRQRRRSALPLLVFHIDTGPRPRIGTLGPRLRRIDRLAAPAAPRHMSAVAGAPDGTDRPPTATVIVAVGARGRRDNDAAAFGVDQVADEVVREIIATRVGHRDVVRQTTDTWYECAGRVVRKVPTCWPPRAIPKNRGNSPCVAYGSARTCFAPVPVTWPGPPEITLPFVS
jgi:hypothetical protein